MVTYTILYDFDIPQFPDTREVEIHGVAGEKQVPRLRCAALGMTIYEG